MLHNEGAANIVFRGTLFQLPWSFSAIFRNGIHSAVTSLSVAYCVWPSLYWINSSMDDALVGIYPEQEKGLEALRFSCADYLYPLPLLPNAIIMYKIFFLMLLATAANSCSKEQKENSESTAPVAQTVNEYPDIILTLADGGESRAKDLKGNNVFVLFQPDCNHCQEEAIQIEQRLEAFKNYTLYFISSAPLDQINAFARDFKLNEKANVRFAWSSTQGVLDFYGPIQTPSVYIYSQGKLKRSFNGQTDIESILNAL